MAKKQTELAVIGAGPGGYGAAFAAADLGFQVTLIDPEPNPGGVCLYRGCIPSKALLHAAGLITAARDAGDMGLSFGAPKIDRQRLAAWKEGVVDRLTGGLGQLSKQRKLTYLRGYARFAGANQLNVDGSDGEVRILEYEKAILATGSRPLIPGPLRLDSPRLWTSTEALELATIPDRLLVIGGGYIGLEMATVYAALGSSVVVAELADRVLLGADKDLARIVRKRLDGICEAVWTGAEVAGLSETNSGIDATIRQGGEEASEAFDAVLVAVGRRPNTEDLGLNNTDVLTDKRGFVRVDATRRSDDPDIYAIGDVAGDPMLAHKATHEGRVAAEAMAGEPAAYDPAGVPAVVFTNPELAWCGLTEEAAKEAGIAVEIGRFPWAASGRAITLNDTDGLTKVICEQGSQRVLGVGIAGPHAGELIAEAAHALEMGATARDLAETIHPHPTLSETLMEAAEAVVGQATHIYKPRR